MRTRSASSTRRAFLDTSAYFAVTDNSDSDHGTARALFERLAAFKTRLFTSNLIVVETHALLLSRLNPPIARRFLQGIRQGTTTLVWVTPDDFQRAYQIIDTYDDKGFSLTDATSFVVMERLGIPYAFTFDRHFGQYGLNVLTSDQS